MSQKYESGSQKRKLAQNEVKCNVKKIPKLTAYFNAGPGENADHVKGERQSPPLTGRL